MMTSIDNVLKSFVPLFKESKNTEELFCCAKEVIPLAEDDYKIDFVQGKSGRFKVKAFVNLKNLEEIADFVLQYQLKNQETLRKRFSSTTGSRSLYSLTVSYRCQHRTTHVPSYNPIDNVLKAKAAKRIKNTDCPFSVNFKILKVAHNGRNCELMLEWNHNHPVTSLQALSFKDIPPLIREKVKDMFSKNYTPGLAYREFTKNLKSECENDLQYHRQLADRSIVPRRRDFNRLYLEYNKEKYGSKDLDSMFQKLKETVNNLDKIDDMTVKFNKFNSEENEPLIVVLITPLMRRVHDKVANSGELVFVDSSGGMEEYNLRVFFIVTYSPVGALPLGIIITSDETLDTLTRAFEMFKDILNDKSFFGRGCELGPAVIMTDNCSELRDALRICWPNAILLLCIFHLLQQVWRWLFDRKHQIENADRPQILTMFKSVMYAKEEEDMDNAYDEMKSCDLIGKYKNLISYLETLYDIREQWALNYRRDLIIRGNNTSNAIESQFLVIKDDILNRTKEVNINGLLGKLAFDLMEHYSRKLLNIASGKFDGSYSNRFKGKQIKSKGDLGYNIPSVTKQAEILTKTVSLPNNNFQMPSLTSLNKTYLIDMNIGRCECEVGFNGDVCKHQYILWMSGNSATNFLPIYSWQERKQFAYIAIGETLPDDEYYGLHDFIRSESVQEDVTQVNTTEPLNHEKKKEVRSTDLRQSIEVFSAEECQVELDSMYNEMTKMISTNASNHNFLVGVSKFCERVKKYPISKLTSALHSFGVPLTTSRKVSGTSMVRQVKKRKIHVQVEATKRRKSKDGSRRAKVKGMNVKKNPFNVETSTKRQHKFSDNVRNNEAVSKKAGRSMSSKTKFLS